MNKKKAKTPTRKNNDQEEYDMGSANNKCPKKEKNCDDCRIQVCPEEKI